MYTKDRIELYQRQLHETISSRDAILREYAIAPEIIHHAWFIMAHMLTRDEGHILHMGCGDGTLTFALATLYPHIHFTGLDRNKTQVRFANSRFDRDNLDFKIGDMASPFFADHSLDGIINSYILHALDSQTAISADSIRNSLHHQYDMLKEGGQVFVQDFTTTHDDRFVLLELPDEEDAGEGVEMLSDANLLVWFSEHVRPRQDLGYTGFFLEELPPQFEGSRLFRLPEKWAHAFILRESERASWEETPPVEHTLLPPDTLHDTLTGLRMRVPFASPQYHGQSPTLDDRFRLYREDGQPLDLPAPGYITVATKIPDDAGLRLSEARPSHADLPPLSVETMRNTQTGDLIDVVTPDVSLADILPYFIQDDGRLQIYLHADAMRSIINTLPRAGRPITAHRYSGHMIEALALDPVHIPQEALSDHASCAQFAQQQLDLRVQRTSKLKKGPTTYPAPDYINQSITCYFLPVTPEQAHSKPLPPRALHSHHFSKTGRMASYDAQAILDAICVGVIPNARLETEILALFESLSLIPENWTHKTFHCMKGQITQDTLLSKRYAALARSSSDTDFIRHSESAGQLRCTHSIFLEEGYKGGDTQGLSAGDINFILHQDNTENIAVILPLSGDQKGEIHAGGVLETMPVPKRHEGSGQMFSAPRYILPPSVSSLRQAQQYLADRLAILPEHIIEMGAPYFVHMGVTPQRVYPFAAFVPPAAFDPATAKFLPFAQMMALKKSLSRDPHMMTLIGRAYRYFHDDLKLDASIKSKTEVRKNWDPESQRGVALPLTYYRAPSLPDPAPGISTEPARSVEASGPLHTASFEAPGQKHAHLRLEETKPMKPRTLSLLRAASYEDINAFAGKAANSLKSLMSPLLKKPAGATKPSPLAVDFEDKMEAKTPRKKRRPSSPSPSPEKW